MRTPPALACCGGGRPALDGVKRARIAGHEIRELVLQRPEAAAAYVAQCRWRGASANAVGWSAPRIGRTDNHTKFASAHVLHRRLAGPPRVEACAGRAEQEPEAMVAILQSRSRRPGAVSLKTSLGQRRGVERPALAAKTTTPSPPARTWFVGGRLDLYGAKCARELHATKPGSFYYGDSKLQPPTWRSVGEEEPRPTAWRGARAALAAKTTTPSPPAFTCPAGGRLILHGAKSARAGRNGGRKM